MKRIHIINQPMAVNNLADIDNDSLDDSWMLKAERLNTKRMRRFKHQWA